MCDCFGQLLAQRVDPLSRCRQRLVLAFVHLASEAIAPFAQRGEAGIGHRFEFGNAIAQRCQRAVHLAVEMQRVPFPGFAEFVELLQPFAQAFERALRLLARRTYRIGRIARCVGDDGQIVAQLGHVGERGFRYAGDPFHFFAVFGHQ